MEKAKELMTPKLLILTTVCLFKYHLLSLALYVNIYR